LYFHGGLVNEENAMASAILITQELKDNTDVYPISFIWETGLLETIQQNLGNITSTDLFKKLLEKVIRIAGEKLGIDANTKIGKRGVGSLSDAEIRLELEQDAPFDSYSVNIAKRSANVMNSNDRFLQDEIEVSVEEELQSDPAFGKALIETLSPIELSLINKDKIVIIPQPGQRGILSLKKIIQTLVTIIFKVVKRFVAKRDHGFYPTVIEEIFREIYIADIGTTLWGFMKAKAEMMWLDDTGTTDLEQHAGRYFLRKLKTLSANDANITIDLIGHSAGAIAICYFMREYLEMQINAKVRNIIFMAPACRSDLFAVTIGNNQASFSNFRMFTMSDKYECLDAVISCALFA